MQPDVTGTDPPGVIVRRLHPADRDDALNVINTAARWYREFLPAAEVHEPEMTAAQWEAEARRLCWYGAFSADTLVGVMGLEYVRDVALLRHAYIVREHQRRGVATVLMRFAEARIQGVDRVIVGTYAANYKARNALEKAGYRASDDSAAVLRAYYAIPEDRLRSSVTFEKVIR